MFKDFIINAIQQFKLYFELLLYYNLNSNLMIFNFFSIISIYCWQSFSLKFIQSHLIIMLEIQKTFNLPLYNIKNRMIITGFFNLTFILAILILSYHSQNITSIYRNLESSIAYEFPFEKTIWTYWVSDTQTPVIVQLCIDNMAATAKKHNFTFILLNQSNVRNYVQNYDELFIEVRKNAVQKSFVSGSDLLRVLVIQQNGGIWFDTTTLFPNGLTDIQNIMIPEFQHLIVNKFSKKPDAMICYFGNAQNRIQKKIADPSDPTKTLLFNEYPNYQAWSLFAKKNSPIMTEIRKTYSKFTVTQWSQLQRHFISEDIFISILDEYGIYFYINMAITYTLQKKQLQFDQQLTLFGSRKFAFEHFNLWGLNAEYGPLMQTRTDLIPYDYLFWYSKDQIKTMGFNLMFFLKQNSHLRQFSQDKFSLLIKYFDGKNTTFDQFIASNLNPDTCQNMTFIVQGFIIAQLLIDSTVSQKHYIPTITKEQHKKWIDGCKANDTWLDRVKQKWQRYDNILTTYMYSSVYIHKARVNSIIHEDENLTLKDWIKIKFDDNVFLLWELLFQTLIAGFLILPLLVLKYCRLKLLTFGNMFFKHQKGSSKSNSGPQELSDMSHFTQDHTDTEKWIQSKQKPRSITLMIFFLLVLNFLMYSDVVMIGGRQEIQTIFISVLITFVIQAYIEDQITKMENNNKEDFEIRWGYTIYSMIINYLVSVLCLTHVFRNSFWVNLLAHMFGMVGPCVMKLKHVLNPQINDSSSETIHSLLYQQSLIYKITYLIAKNKCRSAVLMLMFLSITFPNLRYMAGQSGYYIKYVSVIGLFYLVTNFGEVLVLSFKRHAWKELARLGFLLMMVMRICYTYYEYHYLVQRYRRVSFLCMTIAIMTLLYVQIGSSIDKRFNHQAYWGKLSFNQIQWIFMILPLVIIQILGLEVFMHELMGKFITGFYLHYIFFVFSAFLAFLLYSFKLFCQQPIYDPINSVQLQAKRISKQIMQNLQFQQSNS